jgi:hypothetical protein
MNVVAAVVATVGAPGRDAVMLRDLPTLLAEDAVGVEVVL